VPGAAQAQVEEVELETVEAAPAKVRDWTNFSPFRTVFYLKVWRADPAAESEWRRAR